MLAQPKDTSHVTESQPYLAPQDEPRLYNMKLSMQFLNGLAKT